MTAAGDTIAAIATPPGFGGVGIVRLSGPGAVTIATHITGRELPPRQAVYSPFQAANGSVIDEGIALYFRGPHSFTGEDVVELQGHGGPVVMDMLLGRALVLGARAARPGEFSERAFLNDRLDLAQAEAIADLIESGSERAARAAMSSLRGEFSRRVHALVEQLIELRTYIEAALDFPDEEIDFLATPEVESRLQVLEQAFDEIAGSARQGQLLRDGLSVVIAGPPNAGKSSLMNRLAGQETAIVTDVPGTTRDVLREQILIDGMPLHVVDTAGLRQSPDRVEQEGIRRALGEIERADHVLLVVEDAGADDSLPALREQLPAGLSVTVLRNKIDLSEVPSGIEQTSEGAVLRLSATTGDGLDTLRAHLREVAGLTADSEGAFSARRRHLDALRRAHAHLQQGARQLRVRQAGELMAEELRQAQEALGEITGEFSNEDLLGRIFSSFCIGK